MYTAKSCTAYAPGTQVWPFLAPCHSVVPERDKDLPSISTNKGINRCWQEPCLGHCSLLISF